MPDIDNATLAALAANVGDLAEASDSLRQYNFNLIAGSVDDPASFDAAGKPASDPTHGPLGYYPLLDGSGNTVYYPCRARELAIGAADVAGEILDEAEGYAVSAAGSASTATTKAGEAAGSATTAGTAKTQAEAARDTAVSAKTAAEAARDAALAAPMVYPGAGIPVSGGAAWSASKAAPTGALVGTSDAQTLTNKRITQGIKSISGTIYSLAEADQSLLLMADQAGALSLAILPEIVLSWPVGGWFRVAGLGAGEVRLAAGSGVTIVATPGYKLRAQGSVATVMKVAANKWLAFDDLAAGDLASLVLDIDFTSGVLDPRITFARASTATRVNALGQIEAVGNNVPRFDYNPATLTPRGLLAGEVRTNYLTQSEFANGLPASRGGTVSTTSFAGLFSGTGLAIEKAVSAESYFYVTNYTPPAGSLRVISIFVRMEDGGAPVFGHPATQHAANDFVFNVGGTVRSPSPDNGGKVEDYGGGLYRVSLPITISASPNSFCGVIKYQANSDRKFKVSGIMLEAGTGASAYIPTGASQVTRSAENISMGGVNLTSWFNPVEGTIVLDYDINQVPSSNTQALTLGSSSTDAYYLRVANAQTQGVVFAGGATQANFAVSAVAPIPGTIYKHALAYALNDFAGCLNGGAVQTDNAGSLPAPTDLYLGNSIGFAQQLSGHLRRLRFYNRRLPDIDLQGLTA
ncbi:phage head spike fiber domain-containing protein [Rhizorhabdus histidinilytica]|uniref:phage head spike fiber domain-containing protein n=1 Tax=Rhizorhabdus histidinilytica TaxID=439228 RepID=UPI0032206999